MFVCKTKARGLGVPATLVGNELGYYTPHWNECG